MARKAKVKVTSITMFIGGYATGDKPLSEMLQEVISGDRTTYSSYDLAANDYDELNAVIYEIQLTPKSKYTKKATIIKSTI